MAALDPETSARVATLVETWKHEPGALLPLLHAVQDALGYVPPAAVPLIADGLNLSRAEVHGVISFYHYFRDHAARASHAAHLSRGSLPVDGRRASRGAREREARHQFSRDHRGRRILARTGVLPRQLRVRSRGDD